MLYIARSKSSVSYEYNIEDSQENTEVLDDADISSVGISFEKAMKNIE